MKRAGVQSLVQAVSMCHRAAKTVSQLLNLPSPTTGATSLELMLRNKSSLCNEKPGHHRQRVVLLLHSQRKPSCSNKDSVQPTIKKYIRKKTRLILRYVHLKNPVVDTEVGASLYSFNSRILGEANKNHITGYIKTLEQLPRHYSFLETTFLRDLTSELQ